MTGKRPQRISRGRRLFPEEAEHYGRIRKLEDADKSPTPEFAAMIEANEVAKLLRSAREHAGLTLADMAERTGMTGPALSRLERGDRGNPTIATLGRYAAALGMRLRLELVKD